MPRDEPRNVGPGDLRPGIGHKLIDRLRPALRWVYRHFNPYAGNTAFEQWELHFMRDKYPGAEVWFWVRMTYALLEFAHRNPTADRQTIARAVLALSFGKDSDVNPAAVRNGLKRLMTNPPPELLDMVNFTPDGHLNSDRAYLR